MGGWSHHLQSLKHLILPTGLYIVHSNFLSFWYTYIYTLCIYIRFLPWFTHLPHVCHIFFVKKNNNNFITRSRSSFSNLFFYPYKLLFIILIHIEFKFHASHEGHYFQFIPNLNWWIGKHSRTPRGSRLDIGTCIVVISHVRSDKFPWHIYRSRWKLLNFLLWTMLLV